MTRYFGPPVSFIWDLGTTIEELLEIPVEYGVLTSAVPRAHIRSATPLSGLLIPLGVATPPASGFVLDTGARTLLLTISAKDTYLMTAGANIPAAVAGDIELRFGTGDTAIVWPLCEFTATVKDRWTYFYGTDAP